MEFRKYDWLGVEHEDPLMPRIGTLTVLEPLTRAHYEAPCPLDDRWGSAKPAEYPVYGVFRMEYRRPDTIRLDYVSCDIGATDWEGRPMHPSFHPYGYQLKDYVRPEGTELYGGRVRIDLDPPFRLSPDGNLEGYDSSWLESIS